MPKILCTLGPASLRPDVIQALEQHGVDLFRVNLSHTPLEQVEPTIRLLQRETSVPVCLDTEGAQVRCGRMVADVMLRSGDPVYLTADDVLGTADVIALRPASVFISLVEGDLVSIDFDGALLRITRSMDTSADAVVVEVGQVKSNRAVTIQPSPALPPFTEKDLAAIAIGVRYGLRYFALSFTSSSDDVEQLRGMVAPGSYLIAKIESRAGVRNMDGIMRAADAVLIDRGDLSREVPIEHVPIYQKHIIRRANTWNKPVFVATNLLESMIRNRRPTVAEANDIMNTLLDGAHGLVLAAERSTTRCRRA